ncbi:MAG: STAS domain-containing protein [Verrucomicrobia bacterium]|nr:STAS domain-containing protein [Verrucomicrobiota bacterium]
MRFVFAPKLLQTLREGYDRTVLLGDLSAGLIVGLLAVPLAIGFGIASIPITPPAGLPNPASMGLYTAIVGGFLVSLLGGSRVQIGGPTGAFVPIVAVIAERHGLAGLWLATFLAGLMLVLLGAFRAGGFSRFIPLPVVIGFTSGIAVIIALQQVKDLAGLRLTGPLPAEGWEKMQALAGQLGGFDPTTLLVSGVALLAIFLLPDRWRPRILVLILGALAVNALGLTARPGHPGLATIGSAFGQPVGDHFGAAIPTGWPTLVPLEFSWDLLKRVFPSALVITFLAALESVLSALATDKMIHDHHDADTELIAQGVANLAMPWLGGLPVTGAIARSSANVQSGARTPVAGMVHAVFLAAVLLLAARWIERIPLCILAVILFHVAVRMFESRGFAEVRRVSKGELLVALVTFILTALVDLNWGVGFGLAVAAGSSILRLREITVLREVRHEEDFERGLLVFRIDGVLFYAVADELTDRVDRLLLAHPEARGLILRLGRMMSLDFQGMKALQAVHERCREAGVQLVLCEVQPHPARIMSRDGFFEEVGLENVCGDFGEASLRLGIGNRQ